MTGRALGGVIPALITPMHKDGSVDYDSMTRQVEYLSGSGVHGFFVNGTTSEGPVLTRAEKRRSVELVKEVSAGRQTICAACVAPGTAQVIDEIGDLESVKPDYVVCVTPFYYLVTQRAILDHYEAICKASPFPVIFYDIPQHTRNSIELETRHELVRRGIGAGFKDSTGNFAIFTQSMLECPDPAFVWIQGDDTLDAVAVQMGAGGVVTGLSNITPEPYLSLFAAYDRGDFAAMVEAQRAINRLASTIRVTSGRNISAIKAAVSVLGRCEPHFRFPSLTATREEITAIREIVGDLAKSR